MSAESGAGAPSTAPIRVVVVDDEPEIVELVRTLLAKDPRVELVGSGTNGREALQLANRLHPDVMLLDISMPLLNGLEAAARVSAAFPAIGIVILSAHESLDAVKQALRAGVRDYLKKPAELPRLIDAIVAASEKRDPFAAVKGLASLWCFAGSKAASGCTTLAVSCALDLATLGYRTILLDLDMFQGDCGFYLDLPPGPVEDNLLASLSGFPELTSEMVQSHVRKFPTVDDPSPVYLLESPVTSTVWVPATEEQYSRLLDILAGSYDYIVADLPAGRLFEPLSALVLDAAERVFLISNTDLSSLKALALGMRTFQNADFSMEKIELLLGQVVSQPGFDPQAWLDARLPERGSALDVPLDRELCSRAIQHGVPVLKEDRTSRLALFIRALVERALNRTPQAGPPRVSPSRRS